MDLSTKTLENMVNRPYSPQLQAFILALGNKMPAQDIGVFVRDHESLPEHSSFDVDCLYDPAKKNELYTLLTELEQQHGLIIIHSQATNGQLVFCVDPTAKKEERSWLYLEFHNKIIADCLVKDVTYRDLDLNTAHIFPIPDEKWNLLILCVKFFRKGFRNQKTRAQIQANSASQSVCEDWLVGGSSSIQKFLDAEPQQKAARAPIGLTTTDKLREFLFIHTPFLKGKSIFFTIQGPDGVGKTTLNGKLEDFLQTLPIQTHAFHHITGWKYNKKTVVEEAVPLTQKNDSKKLNDVGFLHKTFRFVYRNILPQNAKALWVDLSNHHKYITSINKLILQGRQSNILYISDRFIDDMFVKTVFAGQPKRSNIFLKAISAFIEKPTKSLLLFDHGSNIVKRKQELTIAQIEEYYEEITKSLDIRQGNYEQVTVTGRNPDEISEEIIRTIILTIGPRIIPAIKSWKAINENFEAPR